MVIIETSMGDIKLALHNETAPQTVENFLTYVNEGFYDGTIFHRVIDNFMIQGGGFTTDLEQKESHDPVINEADNAKPNLRGSVAMARTSDPHSASSQFFINVRDNNFLNHSGKTPDGWGYCVFAEVVEGMEIVDKIKQVETGSRYGHQDVPVDDVIINKISVFEQVD